MGGREAAPKLLCFVAWKGSTDLFFVDSCFLVFFADCLQLSYALKRNFNIRVSLLICAGVKLFQSLIFEKIMQ